MGIGNNFLKSTAMTYQLRKNIDQWDYMKLETSAQQKEMVTR
jgi:hypothetical protein